LFEYIKGKYMGINKDYIILENSGIGYKIYSSGNTISNMPKINDDVLIYIEQIVREDFIGLYGFLTKDELDMFKLLITINGVGSKAALSLLSISNVVNLKYSIITKDVKTITKAPGIGNKIAQRIILELEGKLSKVEGEVSSFDSLEENKGREVMAALVALGYTEKEAQSVIKEIDVKDTVENSIKKSLRLLLK
jgi:holliday junction DNA helicase RuvA